MENPDGGGGEAVEVFDPVATAKGNLEEAILAAAKRGNNENIRKLHAWSAAYQALWVGHMHDHLHHDDVEVAPMAVEDPA